nr:hypothetical protein [Mesorhizobium sophorae]
MREPILPGMMRHGANGRQAYSLWQLAYSALAIREPEPFFDDAPKVDASPAGHPVDGKVWAGFHDVD